MERAPKDGLFNCGQVLCASVAMCTAAGLLASVSLVAELTTHFKVFYLLGAVALGAVFALRRKWRWLAFAGVLAAISRTRGRATASNPLGPPSRRRSLSSRSTMSSSVPKSP